jgi:hypothetical protein
VAGKPELCKQRKQVPKLPVDVAKHLGRCPHADEGGLRSDDAACCGRRNIKNKEVERIK